ncbi:acetyl-CoA C-acyltransferase [Compostibacter hankyongensis]|uniref:acetyl-CoA C-acetyltransferase n=1 Tax=Compostibacter hankyongensis TaxID=1007089 RepID=A0ABP8GAQ8_9BACT
MQEVFIAAAVRTPIGSLNGALSSVPAVRLGAVAIAAALDKAGLPPGAVDEVYMGNVLTAGEGQAPANQASIYAGIPVTVPCTTVNKVCASGMKAILLGAQGILLEHNEVVVAGGMENMSQVPYYLAGARSGYRLGHQQLTDGILHDGLWDPYRDFHMGNAAELCATEYGLSREAQDAYAAQSYRRVAEAYAQGYLQQEIVPVGIPGKRDLTVEEDEEYKRVNFEKISSLKPAFQPGGTVTAANASTINDGAAALVLAGEKAVRERGLTPLARIAAFADASQAPEKFTTTPTLAMQHALDRAGLRMADMDYAEINEAFSCVALANARNLGLEAERLNIWGGAVALGHPIGCSGARIVVTLLNILRQRQARYGIAGICNGGGGASALVLERV